MIFSLPDPDPCCHILSSASLYCPLSVYTVVESRATCHFLRQFPKPSWLDPISLPFQTVVPTPRPLWLSFMVIRLGASFVSHLPFLVLHGSLLSSVGFFLCLFGVFRVLLFSLDFKIPSTAKTLPPFLPSAFRVFTYSVPKFDGKSCLHLNFSF